MPLSPEVEKFMDWRGCERRKHRYMTANEYSLWCRGGDAISSHFSTDSFPGGITIDFTDRGPLVIGRTTPPNTTG